MVERTDGHSFLFLIHAAYQYEFLINHSRLIKLNSAWHSLANAALTSNAVHKPPPPPNPLFPTQAVSPQQPNQPTTLTHTLQFLQSNQTTEQTFQTIPYLEKSVDTTDGKAIQSNRRQVFPLRMTRTRMMIMMRTTDYNDRMQAARVPKRRRVGFRGGLNGDKHKVLVLVHLHH